MRTVAIVGRPNVGKSALFNRLANRMISIVHDQAGITRDRICSVCRLGAIPFEIVDTGGIGFEADPEFAEPTRTAADSAIASADVLLLVADAHDGATPLDHDLARQLRQSGRPLLLVANKIDHEGNESLLADFSGLGIDPVIGVSAAHGRGISELVEAILARIPEDDAPEEGELLHRPRIAIIGRPNVGKSSLTNAILGDKRTIVSDIPGTTRDAVNVEFEFSGHPYTLCDTAGMRHRSRHNTSVEVFSVMRSEKALRSADLCILVVDAQQGVTNQEQKIARMVQEAGKGVLIALNKWDLIDSGEAGKSGSRALLEEHVAELRRELFFLDHAPVVALSAKTGGDVTRLFHWVEKIRQHAGRRIGTGELNRHLNKCMTSHPPPMMGNRRIKILYAVQVEPRRDGAFQPPEIVLFVNDPKLLGDSYRTFLINRIRERWEFPGLPIRLIPRGRPAKP